MVGSAAVERGAGAEVGGGKVMSRRRRRGDAGSEEKFARDLVIKRVWKSK